MTQERAFVPLAEIEPELARQVIPGVSFLVSKKTFAEIAEEMERRSQLGLNLTAPAFVNVVVASPQAACFSASG
jgi:hypothetical protein